MATYPLGPGLFRARYEHGPDVHVYACEAGEAEGMARELEDGPGARGRLVALDRWELGSWRPCLVQPALPFGA